MELWKLMIFFYRRQSLHNLDIIQHQCITANFSFFCFFIFVSPTTTLLVLTHCFALLHGINYLGNSGIKNVDPYLLIIQNNFLVASLPVTAEQGLIYVVAVCFVIVSGNSACFAPMLSFVFLLLCLFLLFFKGQEHGFKKCSRVQILCTSFIAVNHNTLQLFCYLFSSLVKTFPEYRGIRCKKYFTDHRLATTIQLVVDIRGDFSGLFFFLKKSQQKGIPQGLVDKYSHLSICISLIQTKNCRN